MLPRFVLLSFFCISRLIQSEFQLSKFAALKRFIAIFLLLLTAFVVVPADLWHECDHHLVVQTFDDQILSENSDCPICDHTFSNTQLNEVKFKLVLATIHFQYSQSPNTTYCAFAKAQIMGRAPPMLA
jgi:hypothetical protein